MAGNGLRFTLAEVRMHHAKVVSAIEAASLPRLERCGMIVEAEAKRLLSRGGGPRHRPSRPGTPPHLQFGTLRGSVAHALTATEGCIVGPTAHYGKFHEYGTRIHPKRPFMRPALMSAAHRFPSQFRGMI